jgi:DNA-binding SARP family transcriptional activator
LNTETVALRQPFNSDAIRFREAVQSGQSEAALEILTGRLLGEFELRTDSSDFSDWLQTIRDRFSIWRLEALEDHATKLEQSGNRIGALEAHLEILKHHEFSEFHHREVMRLQANLGDYLGALRQFERCREILRRELALEPSPETSMLAERIRGKLNGQAASTGSGIEYRLRLRPLVAGQPWTITLGSDQDDSFILEFQTVQEFANYLIQLELDQTSAKNGPQDPDLGA